MATKSNSTKTVYQKSAFNEERSEPLNDQKENNVQSLFVLCKYWHSDLKFFEDELRFFKRLIDKYFIWLVLGDNINKTLLTIVHVNNLEKRRMTLEGNLEKHLHLLSTIVEHPYPQKPQDYKDGHGYLETEISEFLKEFRKVKKEVFQSTEEVMRTETARLLLLH